MKAEYVTSYVGEHGIFKKYLFFVVKNEMSFTVDRYDALQFPQSILQF